MENWFAHNSEGSQTPGDAIVAGPEAIAEVSQRRRVADAYIVSIDAPENLPVTSDEITLLRTFLANEIRAILYGEDHRG